MDIRDLMNDGPQVGDIVEMELGDTLVETVIDEVLEDGVVIRVNESVMEHMIAYGRQLDESTKRARKEIAEMNRMPTITESDGGGKRTVDTVIRAFPRQIKGLITNKTLPPGYEQGIFRELLQTDALSYSDLYGEKISVIYRVVNDWLKDHDISELDESVGGSKSLTDLQVDLWELFKHVTGDSPRPGVVDWTDEQWDDPEFLKQQIASLRNGPQEVMEAPGGMAEFSISHNMYDSLSPQQIKMLKSALQKYGAEDTAVTDKSTVFQVDAKSLDALRSDLRQNKIQIDMQFSEAANPAQQAAIAIAKKKDQGVAEGKPQKRADRYHINKDGKPATLASYADRDSAIKDRDSKYPDAKVHQVGPRGKVKGEFEEGVAEGLSESLAQGSYNVGLEDIGKRVTVNGRSGVPSGYLLIGILKDHGGLKAKIIDRNDPVTTGYYDLKDISKSEDQTLDEQSVAEGELTAYQKLLKQIRQNAKNDPNRIPRGYELTAHGELVKKHKTEKSNDGVGGLGEGVSEGYQPQWTVEQHTNGHHNAFYLVKGHSEPREVWKNERGLSDFRNKSAAEAKADELNGQGMNEQFDPATKMMWIDQVSQLAQAVSQMSPEELVKLNDAFQGFYRVAGGAAAGAASVGIGGMFYSLLKDTLYAAKSKARVDTEEILQLKRQIISIHKMLKKVKTDKAIAKYQAMLKQAFDVLAELEARHDNGVAEARAANTKSMRKGLANREKSPDPVQQAKKDKEDQEMWDMLQKHMDKKKDGVEEGKSSSDKYIKLLKNHDWTYDYSDDDQESQRGYDERQVLLRLAKKLDPKFKIWNKYAPDDIYKKNLSKPKDNYDRNDPDNWYDESVEEGKTGPGLWANIHAKQKRIKNGSGERMRKPGSEGAPKSSDFKAAASESSNYGDLDESHEPYDYKVGQRAAYTPLKGNYPPFPVVVTSIEDEYIEFRSESGQPIPGTNGATEWSADPGWKVLTPVQGVAKESSNYGDLDEVSIGSAATAAKNKEEEDRRKDWEYRNYIKPRYDNPNLEMDEAKYHGREVSLGQPMAGDVKKSKVYVKNAKGKVVKVNFGEKGARIKKGNPARRKSFRARHGCDNPGPRWKAKYWSCRAW